MTEHALGFWRAARRHPERVAIVDPDGTSLTYGELAAASNRVAHGLRALGLRRGQGVAAVMPNGRRFLELYLAALQSGLYFTAINWRFTPSEIAYVLQDSEARLVVIDEQFAADDAGVPRSSIDALSQGRPDSPAPDRSAGGLMLYTSGTTGRPKGVRRPLPDADPDDAGGQWASFGALFDITPGPYTHLVTAPMYHAANIGFAAGCLHIGRTLVCMDRWSAEDALALIERHRVASTHMVPTMFHRLLALPDAVRAAFDPSPLRSVVHAAAPCPVEVKRRMIDWWGPVLYEYYAATEGSGTYVRPEDWLRRPGTVGRPLPGAEVLVLDDAGERCPPAVEGLVYLRSPSEYHKDPEKTAAARRGEFLTVGDIGYLDEDGWLYLCGRKSDTIVSGGVNVYPAEIEAVLLSHPGVTDAAVVGVPDAEWGEQVHAAVVASAPIERELAELCRARLAGYKCPRSFQFVDELPRDPSGKLLRRLVREPHWAGLERRI